MLELDRSVTEVSALLHLLSERLVSLLEGSPTLKDEQIAAGLVSITDGVRDRLNAAHDAAFAYVRQLRTTGRVS